MQSSAHAGLFLDKILVDAAVQAGAELREDLIVEELVFENSRVSGIRGRMKSNGSGREFRITENAGLIIGADGKHSLVARAVKAQEYNMKPILTCAFSASGKELNWQAGRCSLSPGAAVGIWPTNDGLAMIYTAYPITEFQDIPSNIEGRFWKTMAALPGFAERLHGARRNIKFQHDCFVLILMEPNSITR